MNTISNIISKYENHLNSNENIHTKPVTGQLNKAKNTNSSRSNKLVTLSQESKMALLAHQSAVNAPDTRQDKRLAIKTAIKNGTYVIDAKQLSERLMTSVI